MALDARNGASVLEMTSVKRDGKNCTTDQRKRYQNAELFHKLLFINILTINIPSRPCETSLFVDFYSYCVVLFGVTAGPHQLSLIAVSARLWEAPEK